MDSAVLFFPLRAGRLSIASAFAQHSVNKHKTNSNYREYLPKIQMFQDLASPFIPLCPSSETFLLSPSGYQCSLLDSLSLSLSPYPPSFNLSASQIHELLRPIDVDHVLSPSNSIERDPSSTPSNSIEPMILVSTFQSDLLPWLALLLRPRQTLASPAFLRPFHSVSTFPRSNSRLGGYGIALDIKNTEYKVIDDRSSRGAVLTENDQIFAEPIVDIEGFYFSTLQARYPALEEELSSFRASLQRSQSEPAETIAPIQMKDLGLKLVQRAVHAQDPLRILAESVMQFPAVAASIAHVPISEDLETAWSQIASEFDPKSSFMIMNGKLISNIRDNLNVFQYLKDIRASLQMKKEMKRLNLTASDADALRQIANEFISDGSEEVRLSRRFLESEHVLYLNDLARDPMYSRYSRSLNRFFMGSFQLPMVRANYLNFVMILDPMAQNGDFYKVMLQILHQGVPIRLGILFSSPEIRAFFEKEPTSGIPVRDDQPIHPVQFVGLLIELYKKGPKTAIPMVLLNLLQKGSWETSVVIDAIQEMSNELDAESILEKGDYLAEVSQMTQLVENSGLREGINVLNGKLSTEFSVNLLLQSSFSDIHLIMSGIEANELRSLSSILDFLYSKSTEIGMFDPQLIQPFWEQPFLSQDLASLPSFLPITSGNLGDALFVLPSFEAFKSILPQLSIFRDYSVFLAAKTESLLPLLQLTQRAAQQNLLDAMDEALQCVETPSLEAMESCLAIYLEEDERNRLGTAWKSAHSTISLDFSDSKITLVLNGRVLERPRFHDSFLQSLVHMEGRFVRALHSRFTQPVSRMVSLIRGYFEDFGEAAPSFPANSPFVLSHTSEGSFLDITAVIDPLSVDAQRILSVLLEFRKIVPISYQLLLVPSRDYSELPLKRFYRFVASDGEQATWFNLPSHYLYTMSIETPFKWNTIAYYAECDLDNLRVLDDTTYILAQYYVDALIIEGSCYDHETHEPASRVMLKMSHFGDGAMESDTVVMNDRGYWQLRGNTGLFEIAVSEENPNVKLLDADGREIDSVPVGNTETRE